MKTKSKQMHDALVPAPFSAENDLEGLVKKKAVARAASASTRSVDNWIRDRKIPVVRISKRCVRFHLPSVLTALRKFEVKEAGAK
jgi:hypothetical protein